MDLEGKLPDYSMSSEAPQQAQISNPSTVKKRNRGWLWSLGFGGFLVNADNRVIAPMLPAIAASFHTSVVHVGWLVSAYSIPYGLFQLIYGPLADRLGKINTILASFGLFALGTILCGLVDSFSWLVVLRILTGIFAAGVIPTALAQIGDRVVLHERPHAISFFMSLAISGETLGIVVGGFVAQFFSYRLLFFLLGTGAIPLLLQLTKQRRSEQHVSPSRASPVKSLYLSLLRNPRAWLVYSIVFSEGFFLFGGFTYLADYGVSVLHLSLYVVGLLTATYSVGAIIGSRTIARILRRVPMSQMPMLGASVMAVGFGLIWAFTDVVALAAGFVMLGTGFSYCHTVLQTYSTDLLPEGRATAVSGFAFSLFLGGGLGPIAYGMILKCYGIGVLLAATTLGMAVFFIMTLSVIRSPRMQGSR